MTTNVNPVTLFEKFHFVWHSLYHRIVIMWFKSLSYIDLSVVGGAVNWFFNQSRPGSVVLHSRLWAEGAYPFSWPMQMAPLEMTCSGSTLQNLTTFPPSVLPVWGWKHLSAALWWWGRFGVGSSLSDNVFHSSFGICLRQIQMKNSCRCIEDFKSSRFSVQDAAILNLVTLCWTWFHDPMILLIVQPSRNLILWGRCWLIWLLTLRFPPTSRSACTALHNPNATGFEDANQVMMLPRSWHSGPVLFLDIKNSGNMFGRSLGTTSSTFDCIDLTGLVPTNGPVKRLRQRPSTRRALSDLFGVPKTIWVIFVHQLQNLRNARKHYQAGGLACIVCVFCHQSRKEPDHQYAHQLLQIQKDKQLMS